MINDRIFSQNPIIHSGGVGQGEWLDKFLAILVKIVDEMPPSSEGQAHDALGRARELILDASLRAAAISRRLALEAEPWEWSTLIPHLSAIWRLQAGMVADIGAAFGQNGKLREESIIYCLSRHAAAQFLCELVTGMGERVLARRSSLRETDNPPENIGNDIVQSIARQERRGWLPMIGAIAVAAYAYSDTHRVGRTATEFFARTIKPG